MNNVIAINKISADILEKMQLDVMREEFKEFVQKDPEVRKLMFEKIKNTIDKMSSFDISYYGGFKEVTFNILSSPDMSEHLQSALLKVIQSEKDYDYRVMEAIGEKLAEKLTLTLSK